MYHVIGNELITVTKINALVSQIMMNMYYTGIFPFFRLKVIRAIYFLLFCFSVVFHRVPFMHPNQ